MKKSRLLSVILILFTLLAGLSACSTPAPIENRAGEWNGETDKGSFQFVVSETGAEIIDFSLEYKAGITTFSLNTEGEMRKMIDEDGSFEIKLPEYFGLDFRGQFSPDANSVSGVWEMKSTDGQIISSAEWLIER